MTNKAEFDASIARISEEWNKAEEYVKVAEQIEGKVVFPSIKELRYAGRRVIEALECAHKNEYKQALEYLIDARFDCMRARHDAVDTTVSTAAAEIKAVTDRVGHDVVIRGFPEYSKLITLISDSQVKIASSRFNRNNREAIYANRGQAKIVEGAVVSVDFTSLVVLYRSFQANENVIKSLGKKDRFWQLWAVISTLLLILFGAVGAITAWPVIKDMMFEKSEQPSITQPPAANTHPESG